MGKRSDFRRRAADAYQTIDERAALALLPYIGDIQRYAEPCVGHGNLVRMLAGKQCVYMGDVENDALRLTREELNGAQAIITNPPWTRAILHPMIEHFVSLGVPSWLLFDAAWAHTLQAEPLGRYCTDIVPMPRLRWIEGTTMTGKDDCCWYRFHRDAYVTVFHWRQSKGVVATPGEL